MGHRTLIAYERGDGKYNVHYSHWGGDASLPLRERISADEPLGGDGLEPEYLTAFASALDKSLGESMTVGGKIADAQSTTDVEPEPQAIGKEIEYVVSEMLDFLSHEAFYVVDEDFNVRAFRTWRLFAPDDGEPFEKDVGNGILVEWTDFEDDGTPRFIGGIEGQFRGARDAAQAMYETASISREDANDWLTRYAQTVVSERSTYLSIPEFSPNGYPAENQRKGGYATSPVELRKRLDIGF